ncbi:MAG: hypothetical protein HQ568_05245 [Calditrichaeota bacterium]|nr:hypothetical protein [Calditrichota bacterium]
MDSYSHDVLDRIIAAFKSSPNAHMRSVGGIARETGLSTETILKYMVAYPQYFRQIPIAPSTGSTVYNYIKPRKKIASAS